MTPDEFFKAKSHFINSGEVSVANLQRCFRMTYSDALPFMNELELNGLVTPMLPEGFRVLSSEYAQPIDVKAPTPKEIYTRQVFETALYIVETKLSKRGGGHSQAWKQIKPSNIAHKSALDPFIAQSETIISSDADINENNLLTVCKWVAEIEGKNCLAPPFSYNDIDDELAQKCSWWCKVNVRAMGEPKEVYYHMGLMACARYLHRIYSEGPSLGGGWSRMEIFVHHDLRGEGTSKKWEEQLVRSPENRLPDQLEHVVPCAFIRDNALRLFSLGASVYQAASFIGRHMITVRMLKTESENLDRSVKNGGLGLRTTMPKNWKFGDSIFARLEEAEIEFMPPLWYRATSST